MNRFASGWKRNYYGKGDVIVYRLQREGDPPPGMSAVFGANVLMLVYGDAFWPTYTSGDNSSLVATDSMKNFIQRESLEFEGGGLTQYCHFLAGKFMRTYGHIEGVQVTATEIPYSELSQSTVAFAPGGPDKAMARVEIRREAGTVNLAEVRSGIHGFRLLRLGGSSFQGFIRDQYTTLPDISNRPLHMWLDLEWSYVDLETALQGENYTMEVRGIVHRVFDGFTSGSIQQVIYEMGEKVLEQIPGIAEVTLEANNRTWDLIAENGPAEGVFTDPRPPYGCLGLSLRR